MTAPVPLKVPPSQTKGKPTTPVLSFMPRAPAKATVLGSSTPTMAPDEKAATCLPAVHLQAHASRQISPGSTMHVTPMVLETAVNLPPPAVIEGRLDETKIMSPEKTIDVTIIDGIRADFVQLCQGGPPNNSEEPVEIDAFTSGLRQQIRAEILATQGDFLKSLAEYQKRFDSSLAEITGQLKTATADKEGHTARVTFMEARLDLKVSNLEAAIANGLKTMSAIADKSSGTSTEKPRLGNDLEDKIKETTSLLQVDLAALREEMEGVRRLVQSPLASGDLSGDQSIRRHEIDALREEIKRLSQELSEEKVERARSIAGVCNHAEEVVQHGLNSIGVKDSAKAESNMKQIQTALKKLDAFTQERSETIKTVTDVRNELESVMSRTAELRNSIDSMKAVSEIFGNDIGELRHQCQEVRASARTDAERLTSGLAQLSAAFANSTSASPRVREGGSGSDAMGAVDQIRSDQEDINAQMHDMRTSFESDIQDLQSRLTEVTRLAQEFPARGPISGVLPASAEDRLQNLEGYVAKTRVNQERLDAIFDLAQVMTHGTEKLAKRLHSETAMWKSAKLQNDVRLSRIEKCFGGGIFNVSEGSVGKESVETRPQDHEPEMKEDPLGGTANTVRTNSSGVDTPSLMSKDLKYSLEHLVTRLTKSLATEMDGLAELPHGRVASIDPSRRSPSVERPVRHMRERSPPVSDFHRGKSHEPSRINNNGELIDASALGERMIFGDGGLSSARVIPVPRASDARGLSRPVNARAKGGGPQDGFTESLFASSSYRPAPNTATRQQAAQQQPRIRSSGNNPNFPFPRD